MAELRAGQAVGPLVLLERLAVSEVTTVWLAELTRGEARTERVIAKQLSGVARDDPAVRDRFLEACRSAERIVHPNVVRLLGAVELGGDVFALSEPPDGVPLPALVGAGPLEERLVVWVAREIARAVADTQLTQSGGGPGFLKPSNVFACRDGTVKLADFHVSEALSPLRRAGVAPLSQGSDVRATTGILVSLSSTGAWPAPPLGSLSPRPSEGLVQLLERGARQEFRDLRAFEAALSRHFYASLAADDHTHGREPLAARVAALLPADDGGFDETPTDVGKKGNFTRALEARQAPVRPQPIAADDADEASAPTPRGERTPAVRALSPAPTGAREEELRSRGLRAPGSERLPMWWAILWFSAGFSVAMLIVLLARR